MGGEKFDSTHPEGYLFGENSDLNFLGNRPVAVEYNLFPDCEAWGSSDQFQQLCEKQVCWYSRGLEEPGVPLSWGKPKISCCSLGVRGGRSQSLELC